jgi:hypothetical protein
MVMVFNSFGAVMMSALHSQNEAMSAVGSFIRSIMN